MDEVRRPDMRARDAAEGCGRARSEASQRCGEARDARQAFDAAAERGRELRRRLGAARRSLDEATLAADVRSRQEAKDRARAAYKGEHATADSEAARAEAAARWARAIDGINREARIATRTQAQARQIVAGIEGELRSAEADEQSLRVSAEAAEAACLEARVRLAACEESAHAPQVPVAAAAGAGAAVAPASTNGGAMPIPAAAHAAAPVATLTESPREGPAAAPPLAAGAASMSVPQPAARTGRSAGSSNGAGGGPGPQRQGPGAQPRIGQGIPTVIEALLSGDRRWLERVASHVAETVGRPAPEVFAQLRELIEAFSATAGDHGYVVLDASHEFWSRLSGDESRDVLAALARLGFQFEPTEGWHADRAPVQSDLSMALAYAGLDARSLRHLPTNAQLRELPRSISVDARALLVNEAPDLALDHVVRMLGHRADSLGRLWDDWGYVRPILLSDPRALL